MIGATHPFKAATSWTLTVLVTLALSVGVVVANHHATLAAIPASRAASTTPGALGVSGAAPRVQPLTYSSYGGDDSSGSYGGDDSSSASGSVSYPSSSDN